MVVSDVKNCNFMPNSCYLCDSKNLKQNLKAYPLFLIKK